MTFSTVSASRRTKSPVYLRAEAAASHAAFIAQPVVAAGLILKAIEAT
jgi:hypothetical protein